MSAIDPFSIRLADGNYYTYGTHFPTKLVNSVNILAPLSQINRYNGQLPGAPVNVLAHSLLVYNYVVLLTDNSELHKAAFIHDFHEAIVGDIVSPLIRYMTAKGFDITEVTKPIDDTICKVFKVNPESLQHPIVKLADKIAIRFECDRLMYAAGTVDITYELIYKTLTPNLPYSIFDKNIKEVAGQMFKEYTK